jgi:hypothetical protein
MSPLNAIFEDNDLIDRIRNRLPRLFFLAEAEVSKAGKLGMEIGSVRERIIIALLIYKFGENNIRSNVHIHERGKDVIVCNRPVSIKTISSRQIEGIKAFWTEDISKANDFMTSYDPQYDILLTQVNWRSNGVFALIPFEAQQTILNSIGRERYLIRLHHHKGIEFSKEAISRLIVHPYTKKIVIFWNRPEGKHDQYEKWLYYWTED